MCAQGLCDGGCLARKGAQAGGSQTPGRDEAPGQDRRGPGRCPCSGSAPATLLRPQACTSPGIPGAPLLAHL